MLKPVCDDNMKGLGSPEDVQENRTKHYKFSSNHPSGIGQPFTIISHYNMSMLHFSIDTKALGIHFNSSSPKLDIKTEMISCFRWGRSSIVASLRVCLPRSLTAWAKAITSSKSSRQSVMKISTRVAPQYMSSWKEGREEFMRWAGVSVVNVCLTGRVCSVAANSLSKQALQCHRSICHHGRFGGGTRFPQTRWVGWHLND